MRKKLLSVVLAMTIAGAMIGCAQSAPAAAPAAPAASSAAEEKAEEPAAEAPAEEAPADAAALDWPNKEISIYVGAKTGGDSDFNARSIAEPLTRELGQTVNVVNVAGGTGSVALEEFMSKPGDGYSFMLRHIDQGIINTNGLTDYTWDDFKMVAIYAEAPGYCFCVQSSSDIKTMDDLKAAAEANPGGVKFAVNTGGTSHIMVVNFCDEAGGIEFNIIDGGSGSEKLVELIGGHIDATLLPFGTCKDYYESGEIRIIGTTDAERNELYSDCATCREQGYDVVWPIRYSLVAQPDTPDEIVTAMAAALKNIVENDTEYQKVIMDAYAQRPFFLEADAALEWYKSLQPQIEKYSEALLGG